MNNQYPIDLDEWRNLFKVLSDKIMPTCGLSYELYLYRLSAAIDDELNKIDKKERALIIEMAREEFSYMSAEEVEKSIELNAEEGFCKHGLEFNCCPLGCGEI